MLARRAALRSLVDRIHESPPGGLDAGFLADGPDVDVDLGDHLALIRNGTFWVLESPEPSRVDAVAAALAWVARRNDGGAPRLVLLARGASGVAARRLAGLRTPAVVLGVAGGAVTVRGADPHLPITPPSPAHLDVAEMFGPAGADVVVEHGVVSAEVVGLEVARVVDEDGAPTLRIGVGAHDRETFRALHGDVATGEQLAAVVATVSARRRVGADLHPLNLLARERALRHRVVGAPASVGLAGLSVAEPPVPRTNLKDDVPCCAIGVASDGVAVVAVFVSGVDLGVVPFAVDARTRLSPHARLLIVTEQRNIVPVQRRIADLFRDPVEFVAA